LAAGEPMIVRPGIRVRGRKRKLILRGKRVVDNGRYLL